MSDKDFHVHVKMPPEAKGLSALIRAADKEKPDPDDVATLFAYYRDHPDICNSLGNLCEMALYNTVNKTWTQTSTYAAIYTRLRQMRDGFGYQDASELERSLIEHAILCWVRLHEREIRYHQAGTESMTLTKAEWWERMLAHNQKRYLRAVETLARVRRLLKPAPSPVLNMMIKQQLNLK